METQPSLPRTPTGKALQERGIDIEAALDFILAHLQPLPNRVLDIGTGRGRILTRLATAGISIVTVDHDPVVLQTTQADLQARGLANRIQFLHADAAALPLPDASFPLVLSVNTLHHLPDPEPIFQEMVRVLQPGGRIVVSDWTPDVIQAFNEVHATYGRRHPSYLHPPAKIAEILSQLGCIVRTETGPHQILHHGKKPATG